MFPREASKRRCSGGCVSRRPGFSRREPASASHRAVASRLAVALRKAWLREGEPTINLQQSTLNLVRAGFTLVELLIVIGIIAVLLVLIAPAFTTVKSSGDVTSAAYTIKGMLDTARTYAKANNTYTWVGFFEEDVSQGVTSPATGGTGRVVMSIVASEDGSKIYDPINLGQQTLTSGLIQVGKLIKIENIHLWTHTDTPSGTGWTFDTRTNVASTYCIGDASRSNSTTPFGYPVGNPAPTAQYTFVKAVEFSPRGEPRINNSTINSNGTEVFPLQTAAEIALKPTRGALIDDNSPNLVAIQFTGVGGNVRIYRK